MSPAQEIWRQTLTNLEAHVAPHLVELWLRPLRLVRLEDEKVVVSAPNQFTHDWVREHFLRELEQSLPDRTGRPYQLVLTFGEDATDDPAEPPDRAPSRPLYLVPPKRAGVAAGAALAAAGHVPVGARPPAARPTAPPARSTHPLPAAARLLTFERFVIGPSNRLAVAAARAIVEAPEVRFNPLFLNAPVGLGKTHLACAVVNELIRLRPRTRVAFAPAERYLADMVAAIAQGRIESFKERYRRNVDLLVVDDVQFLAGKKRTQSEFFHALDELVADGKQVLLTGNGNPASIPDLAEPLRSRLGAGLVVEIDPPEHGTRVAIVAGRATERGVPLPEGVAEAVASVATVSVRDLEGALNRVLALASLTGEPVTLPLAEEALKPYRKRQAATLTPERIMAAVARAWGLDPARLRARSRRREVLIPRQVVLYFCRKYTPASLASIGELVGRNHSSVIHSLTTLEKRLLSDRSLRQKVEFIEQRLLTEPATEDVTNL